MPKKLGIKGTFRGSMDTDAVRVHPRFLRLEPAKSDAEVFFVSELAGIGISSRLAKKWAKEQGILKEGRAPTEGRRFLHAVFYLDRAGLEMVVMHFRALEGAGELRKGEWAAKRGRLGGILSEK